MIDVKKKLDEIIEGQEGKICTMTIDLHFFNIFLATHNEEELRKELEEEKELDLEKRDNNKINKLNELIDRIEKVKADKADYESVLKEIKGYVKFLRKETDKARKILNDALIC